MNKLIRCVIIPASIAVAAQAAPFMAVGDGAELFATGVLGVRADDNILLAKDGTSDMIFDITPGLELDFGKNAQTQGTLTLADTFSNYADNSGLNTNLFQGNFVTKYDDGKMKLGFNAGYNELNQNSVDVRPTDGKLVRRDITTASGNGEVGISELTVAGAGVAFTHENYHPSNYVDSETLVVPINFYYKWTPKIEVGLGYQYRDYQVKNDGGSVNALDSIDNFYAVTARGEFSPKLTGKFAIGYTERRFSQQSSSRSLMGVDGSFAYEVSPKTTVEFGVSNDFGTSPTGQQQKNLTIRGGATTKLSEEWSVNGGISYRGIRYDRVGTTPSRTDDYYEANIGAAYIINANIRLLGTYTYRTYQSDLSASEFDNNVFSVAANFRY